jgi:hypothetical protein
MPSPRRSVPVDPRRYASAERLPRSTLGELDRIAREHEERERPFDPYVPPERYARAHHFAVNSEVFRRNGDVIEFPGRYAHEQARMQAEADAYQQWLVEVAEQVILKSGVEPLQMHDAFVDGVEPAEVAAYIIDHI